MIIHLTGSDTYRSAQRLAELRRAFTDKHDPKKLGTIVLDGSTATVEELRTALTATGFFSTKRFVAVDYFLGDGLISPATLTECLAPVAAKNHDVVAVVRDLLPDQATRTGKRPATTTKKKTAIKTRSLESLIFPDEKRESFPQLTAVESVAWVVKKAKKDGGTIVPTAAERLVMLCGRDSWRIASELEKLLAYTGGRPIIVDDVNALVRSEYASDIFALTDALGQQQTARALELLHRELAAGTNEFALIATLSGHVRNLYAVQQAQANGLTPGAMASQLGLHPFVIQKAVSQTSRFEASQLRDLHHRLLAIDNDLKTTPLDPETLLDLLVVPR